MVTVLPPEGKGIPALPLGAQAAVAFATGADVAVATGAEVAAGVAAGVAGVGPQDASSMLAKTNTARMK